MDRNKQNLKMLKKIARALDVRASELVPHFIQNFTYKYFCGILPRVLDIYPENEMLVSLTS